MEEIRFDIAELIGKYLAGQLTLEEQKQLDEWLMCSADRLEWFKVITGDDYVLRKLDDLRLVNVEKGWRAMRKKRLKELVHYRGKMWLKYAALFLLPIIGVWLYLNNQTETIKPSQTVEFIEAGSSKARLVLADGRSVALEEREPGVLLEEDGAQITLEAEHVSYENARRSADSLPVYNELIVPCGGEYSLTLSDGTFVFLNANSKLRFPVDFSGKYREVELEGEGYFEVASDTSAPFIVKTRKATLQVLGTTFNLSAYLDDSYACATLLEGKVKVVNPSSGESVVLNPNEQAVLLKDKITVDEVDVSYAVAWKDGRLRFQEKSLEEIMRIAARWYNVNVVYRDDEVKDYVFGCNINRHATIEGLLKVFERTGKIKTAIIGRTIFIERK